MTTRAVYVVMFAMAAASISHAQPIRALQLRSCTGQEYVQMKPTLAQSSARGVAPTCLTQGRMTVCRRKLDENPDGDTSEVTVSTPAVTLAQWREQGDPAYVGNMLALNANKSNVNVLVIATLQSESQGMGTQEWSVNVLTTAVDGGSTSRRTLNTSEFGALGSVVKSTRRTIEPCRLLTTRWEERETKQGKRLFLVGELADILANQDTPSQPTAFVRRFDHRLEKLRLSNRVDRPMIFFQK